MRILIVAAGLVVLGMSLWSTAKTNGVLDRKVAGLGPGVGIGITGIVPTGTGITWPGLVPRPW